MLNFYLDRITLRHGIWFWVLLIIPSIIGFLLLVKDFELLKNDTYQKLTGVKLTLYKIVIIASVLFGSTIMFGGYLDNIALGTNYIFRSNEVLTEEFQVLDVKSKRPGFQRRTKKRVPLLQIANNALSDEVELSGTNYENFDTNIERINIRFQKGLWGWGVIE